MGSFITVIYTNFLETSGRFMQLCYSLECLSKLLKLQKSKIKCFVTSALFELILLVIIL